MFSPVRSRVVPAGTATFDRVIVEQDFLDLIADAAPFEPENVQEDDLRSRAEATDGWISGVAGTAWTEAAPRRATRQSLRLGTMMDLIPVGLYVV